MLWSRDLQNGLYVCVCVWFVCMCVWLCMVCVWSVYHLCTRVVVGEYAVFCTTHAHTHTHIHTHTHTHTHTHKPALQEVPQK